MTARLFTDGHRSVAVGTDPSGRVVLDFQPEAGADPIRLSLSTGSAEGLALDLIDAVKEIL